MENSEQIRDQRPHPLKPSEVRLPRSVTYSRAFELVSAQLGTQATVHQVIQAALDNRSSFR